ncbi:MAG: hypothetical protein EXS05_04525 [Planctomycetaceae bacterium]|nr:hypothetical protein [Planctomycetaceae bacterium]
MAGRRRPIFLQLAACCALAFVGRAATWAAEPRDIERQTREFKVSVDGKERGQCVMKITRRNDGVERLQIDSQLRFNYVVYEYRYSSSGSETWKAGRLTELENTADFNGKKYVVKARPGRNDLQVTVNGKGSPAKADAWVTSYWQLPEHLVVPDPAAKQPVVPAGGRRAPTKPEPKLVPLLDSDQGRALHGKLERIGEETIRVAGRRQTATHYRISGDVEVELWYDASRRLVRQESVDEGHKTQLELLKITDQPDAK